MKMIWVKVFMFDIKVVVVDFTMDFLHKGNQFIMQVLVRSGYPKEVLLWLNCVQVARQHLFMLDILTASGNKVNPEILSQCPNKEAWSDMRWPTKQLLDSDFQLWRIAIVSICPSRRGTGKVEQFIAPTHRIWRWTWNIKKSTLPHLKKDGKTEDIFISGCKPNRFHYSHCQPRSHHHMIFLVEPTSGGGHSHLTSTEPLAKPMQHLTCFLDVLQSWGNTCLWKHLTVMGGVSCQSKSVTKYTLVAITDGSYIRELFPHLCSAAFIL